MLEEKFEMYDAEELLRNSSKSPLALSERLLAAAAAAAAAFCCESASRFASAALIVFSLGLKV
jgi:hypothetical protein